MGTRYNRFNVLSKYIKIHFFFLNFFFLLQNKVLYIAWASLSNVTIFSVSRIIIRIFVFYVMFKGAKQR